MSDNHALAEAADKLHEAAHILDALADNDCIHFNTQTNLMFLGMASNALAMALALHRVSYEVP